jgi:Mrp family chromosome partitioning ATPase
MHEALGPYVATLRDRVVKAMDPAAHRPHLIGVTGCAPGSGVSTLAAGLAVTLASSGDGRVLLVDAHVGPSADNRVFGTTPTSGALDIRVEGQSCTSVVQPNLYFLSTQPPRDAADPVNVLQGFADLVTHVSETPYDFVVFDMPPVSDTSLTPRVAGAMAHVILVIRAETIRREAALRASQLLARSGGKVLGAVLNMRKFYVPNWLYRSY